MTATLIGLAAPTASVASGEMLRNTFKTCANLGEDIGAVTSELAELGWIRGESPRTTADMLFWSVFAHDFSIYTDEVLSLASRSDEREKQLRYLLRNASFMSASILGNSALPPDQPNYSHGPYRLAVLGVSLGTGYCVLSGPGLVVDETRAIQDFVERWPDDIPRPLREGVSSFFGEASGTSFFAASFDESALRSLYGSANIELPLDAFPDTILHISQKRPQ